VKGTREEQTNAMRIAAAARIDEERRKIILDLYEPVHPKDDPRGSPGGSSITQHWRAGQHGARTVRVEVSVSEGQSLPRQGA
jgi:hypothetical protein